MSHVKWEAHHINRCAIIYIDEISKPERVYSTSHTHILLRDCYIYLETICGIENGKEKLFNAIDSYFEEKP